MVSLRLWFCIIFAIFEQFFVMYAFAKTMTKSSCATIQIKATSQYFPVVQFTEKLSYFWICRVKSCRAVHYCGAVQGGSNFNAYGWHLPVFPALLITRNTSSSSPARISWWSLSVLGCFYTAKKKQNFINNTCSINLSF